MDIIKENGRTSSKRMKMCEDADGRDLFSTVEEFRAAIKSKIIDDSPDVTEKCSTDSLSELPLYESIKKSNRTFKDESNNLDNNKILKSNCSRELRSRTTKLNEKHQKHESTTENDSEECATKLKLIKKGRNSTGSTPQAVAKTNKKKLSSNSLTEHYIDDISPIKENTRKCNKTQNGGLSFERNVFTSPPSRNAKKLSNCNELQSSNEKQPTYERENKHFSAPAGYGSAVKNQIKQSASGTDTSETNNSYYSSSSSDELSVSVKENVGGPTSKSCSKPSFSDNSETYTSGSDTISPENKRFHLNNLKSNYEKYQRDTSEESSQDESFSDSRESALNNKSKCPTSSAENFKTKAEKVKYINKQQQKLSDIENQMDQLIEDAPHKLRRKSQRISEKENKNPKTKDKSLVLKSKEEPTVKLPPRSTSSKPELNEITSSKVVRIKNSRGATTGKKSNKYSGAESPQPLSESESAEEMCDTPKKTVTNKSKGATRGRKSTEYNEEMCDTPEKTLTKLKGTPRGRKSNNKPSTTKSPRTPLSLASLASEVLGSSWDRSCTPPRRFSMRLKSEPGSGTPSCRTRYLSLGNTPRSSLRFRKNFSETSDFDDSSVNKSKSTKSNTRTSKKRTVKTIDLSDSDNTELESDLEIKKPTKNETLKRTSRKAHRK